VRLRVAAQRGLVSVFETLSHKCPSSRLGKHDETGMTLMHHAAVHNRPHIITILVQLAQDVNVRKISSVFAAGWSCLCCLLCFAMSVSRHLLKQCAATFFLLACLTSEVSLQSRECLLQRRCRWAVIVLSSHL